MTRLHAGLDVSIETTSVCVVDEDGRLRQEAEVASEPRAVADALPGLDGVFERVGLEAGPPLQRLFLGLCDAGLPTVCVETRPMRAAIARRAPTGTTATTPARPRGWSAPAGSKPCM